VSINVVHTIPEEEWHCFVEEHPAGNIFHTPEMFRVFSRTKGHRPTLWVAVDSGNHPLALMLPVQITLFDGLLRRFTTRAVAYGGPLCAPGSKGKEALAMLLQFYNRKKSSNAFFTELRNLSDLSELQSVLNDNGFEYEDHLNFLIDLNRPPEAILQSIGKRTRKHIRRALGEGIVVIEEVVRHEQLSLFYELLQKTYAAVQVPLADQSLFRAAFDVLRPRGMVKFFLAKVGDDYAAGSVELIYKEMIYGWYGGIDRSYSKYNPNELMMWHIFQWGAENGYKVYDFGGAGKPNEEYGVRDFKAKFGGELVCFGRNTYVHSTRMLRLSNKGYRLLRRWL
jgi:lipid II:glycine glycyltransferase (peptidoglycan interpeptide bridge formation enzyme)